jgi:uncharacterized protein HemY
MKRTALILLAISLFAFKVKAQNGVNELTAAQEAAIQKLRAKVEANPSNLEVQEKFIDAFPGMYSLELEKQYKAWILKYPKNYTFPFAIGKLYVNRENPKATTFLLQAGALKPDKAEIWYLLASDAMLSNDVKKRQEYLKKAMQLDPKNADYAFYYADAFDKIDQLHHDSLLVSC